MSDPYKGVTLSVRYRGLEEAKERFALNLFEMVDSLRRELDWSWDELAYRLPYGHSGDTLRQSLTAQHGMTIDCLPEILYALGMELHFIARPSLSAATS